MKKKVLYTFSMVFIICIAAAFILLRPYLKTALGLGKVLTADSLDFHATVRLNPDSLSENERGLLDTLEWIFQAKEDLLNLKFTGRSSENEMTVKVYCNAVEYPLTEIHCTDNQKTINIKMFYEAIEKSLPDKLWLLKMILPEWKALGIDMEALIPLEKVQDLEAPSAIECFYLLSRLEKEKDENGHIWFRGNYENYSIRFCVKEKEDGKVILLKGEGLEEDRKAESFEADISTAL